MKDCDCCSYISLSSVGVHAEALEAESALKPCPVASPARAHVRCPSLHPPNEAEPTQVIASPPKAKEDNGAQDASGGEGAMKVQTPEPPKLGSAVALSSDATPGEVVGAREKAAQDSEVVEVPDSLPLTATQPELDSFGADLPDRQHDGPSPVDESQVNGKRQDDVEMEVASEEPVGAYIPEIGDEGAPAPVLGEHTLSDNAIRCRANRIFKRKANGQAKVSEEIFREWHNGGEPRRSLEQIFRQVGYSPDA